VAGIEVSDAMLAHARRRFRRELDRGRLELERAGATEIPYEAERFDRALATHTIYFWPDPAAALREIDRVLKPGGRLVPATEAGEAMEKRSYTRHGFRTFGDRELERLLEEAGFSAIVVERDGRRVFSVGVAS
jgi:SAM-dependent methyltransferase